MRKNEQAKKRAPAGNLVSARMLCRLILLLACSLFIGYILISCSKTSDQSTDSSPKPALESGLPPNPGSSEIDTIKSLTNSLRNAEGLAKFSHTSQYHAQLSCLVCHRRDDNSASIRLPGKEGHTPCIGCHTQQFADSKNSICTICHTNSETGAVKAFPPLRSFGVKFDHARHMKSANCADCHKPSQAGIAKSIPSGANAHTTCFQCHSASAEHNLSSCSVCHEAGQRPPAPSESSEAYQRNFSHAEHNLDCTNCHSVKAGEKRGSQVATLVAISMHSPPSGPQSCATCHNGKRAFGAADFSDCRRCHQQIAGARSFGVSFSHSAHSKTTCATCHKPAGRRGITFSIPEGGQAHATCFQCHSPMKAGSNMNNSYCFACHQAGQGDQISPAAAKIGGNFSHTKHKGLSCNSCHSSQGAGMNAPAIAMHKAPKGIRSCASCHNNQKAFGGDDFSDCKRCHTGNTFKF